MATLTASKVLNTPLTLPIRVLKVNGAHKLMAGGAPVTAVNTVIDNRRRFQRATQDSLDTYMRAARLYAEFCAHLGRAFIDISNSEFISFKNALLGSPFPDVNGNQVYLAGARKERSADLMITLLYSLVSDIEELYGVHFDWHRYKGMSEEFSLVMRRLGVKHGSFALQRQHRIKYIKTKVIGLPDDQFVKLLQAAYSRWGTYLSDGDVAFAENPEAQRGALFYRNVAILLGMRLEGGRRSEVPLIRLKDIDRAKSTLYMVTKGHGGKDGERLPVLMFPVMRDAVWYYLIRFRPVVGNDPEEIFLSHSVRNYGTPISSQSVRKVIDVLRPALDPPWDRLTTPHTLRHSFAYDLQKFVSPATLTANMRQSSISSSDPYRAGIDIFAEEITEPANAKMEQLLAHAGLARVFQK